jgi:hypothetical protein
VVVLTGFLQYQDIPAKDNTQKSDNERELDSEITRKQHSIQLGLWWVITPLSPSWSGPKKTHVLVSFFSKW